MGAAGAIGLIVAAFGQYSIKMPLSGVILPDTGLVTVQSPADGVITSLLAAEGAHLDAGDPVLTLTADAASGAAVLSTERILVAPVAGRVVAISAAPRDRAHTAEPLMQILPDGATLEAVLMAPGAATATIRTGQEVHLRYPGISSDRSAPAKGTVVRISTTLIDLEVGPNGVTPGPARRIVVALPQQTIAAGKSEILAEPGLAVSAEIIRDRRSMLAWVFSPIFSALRNRREGANA